MLVEHDGRRPRVHPSAHVAPTAVLSGAVHAGPGCRVLFGAVLTDEGGRVELGEGSIVMENAVVRGTRRDAAVLGERVLVGPHAHVVGAHLERDCFVATGASVFNGAHLGPGCEVRVNAVVHLRTVLAAGTVVPIGWVAVGSPPLIAPPGDHEEIWAVQRGLDFPGYVLGAPRDEQDATGADGSEPDLLAGYRRLLGTHADDTVLDGTSPDTPDPRSTP